MNILADRLPAKKWPPLYPPYHFPSNQPGKPVMDSVTSEHHPQRQEREQEFEIRGQLDLESIPHDEPPQVQDYPIYEDNSHEEKMESEFGQHRDEL